MPCQLNRGLPAYLKGLNIMPRKTMEAMGGATDLATAEKIIDLLSLEAVCYILGWQGGTRSQAAAELSFRLQNRGVKSVVGIEED